MSTGVLKEEINCSYRNSVYYLEKSPNGLFDAQVFQGKKKFCVLVCGNNFFPVSSSCSKYFFMSANNLFVAFLL